MVTLEHLLAKDAIRDLKHRYFHSVDAQNWDAFGALFAEDAVMDMRAAGWEGIPVPDIANGRAAIVTFVSATLKDWRSIHHGYSPLITLEGPDTASAEWHMDDQLFRPDGKGWTRFVHGYGTYHERYVRREGVWLYAHVRLTRSHVDVC